jgi:hypothetical protein
MQAEEKRETDASSSVARGEARPYDAFSYDLAAANLSGQSGEQLLWPWKSAGSSNDRGECCGTATSSNASRASTSSSSRRVTEPGPDDYEIRAEDVKIESKLGEGYFGEVFQGSWLGQPIAAKVRVLPVLALYLQLRRLR